MGFLIALLLAGAPSALLAASGTSPLAPGTSPVASTPVSSTLEEDLASSGDFDVADLEWQDLEQQIDVGELREAQTTLEHRVVEMQQVGDRYNEELVKPLSLLGRIYHEQKDYPRAAETFAQATQISRVANGLHSGEQLALVHMEIASLKAMGNIVEANSRHEYAFSIASRHYGRFDQQLIPELLKLGTWYTQTGDIIGARGRFSDARVLLSARQETAESDMMVLALRGLAKSYRDERYPPFYERPDSATRELLERNGLDQRQALAAQRTHARLRVNALHRGSQALLDVVRIQSNRLLAEQEKLLQGTASDPTSNPTANQSSATANGNQVVVPATRRKRAALNIAAIQPAVESPSIDKADFLSALLEVGDWYLLVDEESRAFAWYQMAYRIAVADPNTDADKLLGKPKLLYFPRPRDPKLPERVPTNILEQGHVALQFDINHRGQIKRLTTVESQPRGLMDFPVRASAKISRYRPRIVEGLPQPTMAFNYTHSFSYLPRGKEVPPNVINSDQPASERNQTSVPASAPSSSAPTSGGY